MRKMNLLAFNDFVMGTTAVYTPAELNAQLAVYDNVSFQSVSDQVSGTTPTLTVQIEHSGDNRNFHTKNATAEINGVSLSATATTVTFGYDTSATTIPLLSNVRLKISLAGTAPVAHVKIHLTGRDQS